MRWLNWVAVVLLSILILGCGGDEKGVNQNKEKPQPAAK